MAILRQSTHRPALLACLAHLVVREGPFVQGSFHVTRDRDREKLFLVIFDGIERGTWLLRDVGREHSGFYGTFGSCSDVLDTDWCIFSAICGERKIVRPTIRCIIESGEVLTWGVSEGNMFNSLLSQSHLRSSDSLV
jgi:hypothetical protein